MLIKDIKYAEHCPYGINRCSHKDNNNIKSNQKEMLANKSAEKSWKKQSIEEVGLLLKDPKYQ